LTFTKFAEDDVIKEKPSRQTGISLSGTCRTSEPLLVRLVRHCLFVVAVSLHTPKARISRCRYQVHWSTSNCLSCNDHHLMPYGCVAQMSLTWVEEAPIRSTARRLIQLVTIVLVLVPLSDNMWSSTILFPCLGDTDCEGKFQKWVSGSLRTPKKH